MRRAPFDRYSQRPPPAKSNGPNPAGRQVGMGKTCKEFGRHECSPGTFTREFAALGLDAPVI